MLVYGGSMNKGIILTTNKDIILSRYLEGATIKILAEDYAVSATWMRKFLLKNNIKIVHNTKQRKFDETFFFTPSMRLAYFMGFCLADGSITAPVDHHSTLEISVHTQDISLLEKFCEWTQYDVNFITKRKDKELLRLCYNNKIFKEDFSKWGLVNNKTYEPQIPVVSQEHIKPFLIGYIDGDGSINFSKEGNYFNVVGHRKIIDWFCDTIKELGFNLPFKFEDIEGKVWKRARIYKRDNIVSMIKCLDIAQYQDIFLHRKWDKALALI
jgi:hypothetical protein